MKLKITYNNGDKEKIEQSEEEGKDLMQKLCIKGFELVNCKWKGEEPNRVRIINFRHVRKVERVDN